MPPLPATTEWLRAPNALAAVGVDRDKKILRGYVVAQKGPFKTPGRGEFDDLSLDQIVQLYAAKPAGLKSRFTHPDMSNDGLGKYLGRSRDAKRDGDKVRADLHFDDSAFNTPSGNLAGYVMQLAENDPDALSSSLVLKVDKEVRLEADGTAKKDEKGNRLPPLWRPTALHASDVVDTGDAVDGILSAELGGLNVDELPDALLHRGAELLDRAFPGQPRDVVHARLSAFLGRYLDRRYGPAPGRTVSHLRRRMKLQELTLPIGRGKN